jgi:heat shock protein HtpX
VYEQIARNKRASWLLALGLVAILMALGFVMGLALFGSQTAAFGVLGVFGIVAIVWSLIGYYAGSKMVLAVAGAREVSHDEAPQLWNVVEEMAIAGGIPLPRVYVIDDPAPNAFATGRDPRRATVAVTSGLLATMDREELQGVIAHELSHVRNYDIRFMTLVGILVGVIALVCDFFLRFTFFGGGDDDNGGGNVVFLILGLALAIIAPLVAMIVQFSVSRQREFLADASAVELSRNPAGLASALEKIAADPRPLRHATRATQHLYIANPLKKKKLKESSGLFDTHPPISERIAILRAMEHGAVSSPEMSPVS